ncbi:hypothetical protein [Actinomadura montaniterrae]|uniref:Uncharacterized protein n=1 Tax=Actinomadura montaniterrae TaxID=1803903 RepID=A0A6L3VKT6_9ACTN|nr:hypothetical protein [Actinomadura montaniterrae]KAB2372048.1 hypothetical protein F9B16_30750 [Actinomadura montaniterrae]
MNLVRRGDSVTVTFVKPLESAGRYITECFGWVEATDLSGVRIDVEQFKFQHGKYQSESGQTLVIPWANIRALWLNDDE